VRCSSLERPVSGACCNAKKPLISVAVRVILLLPSRQAGAGQDAVGEKRMRLIGCPERLGIGRLVVRLKRRLDVQR